MADGRDWLIRSVQLGERVVDVRVGSGSVLEIGRDLVRRSDAEQVVAGGGRRLLPGLRDAHVHFATWAVERRNRDVNHALAAATSPQDAGARLADVVATRGRVLGVLQGTGFRQATWDADPHKAALDRALPDVAVVLSSQDQHSSWWSSRALAVIGLDHPTGHLREHASWKALQRLPADPPAVVDRAVREAMQDAAARGVTSILDFEFTGPLADWRRRAMAERLPMRVAAAVVRDQLDEAIDQGWRTGRRVVEHVTIGPLKLFADGALGSRSAWCDHSFVGEPDNRGMSLISREDLTQLITRAHRAGLETAVHAIGDAANTTALDAYAAARVPGRIEHAQLLDERDVGRFAALDVTASVQPSHAVDDQDIAGRWWADRLERAYPLATLRHAGARVLLGSDAPVAPLDPWRTIAAAVARTIDHRPPWMPDEAVSLEAALAMSVDGPVRVGGAADLVITDQDPFEVPASELVDLPVWATMVDGRWTHQAP